VFVLHAAAPSGSARAAKVTPMAWQTFVGFRREMEALAQAPDLPVATPAAPRPRTQLQRKQEDV
jgi:hypothetical protein